MLHITNLVQFMAKVYSTSYPGEVITIGLERGWVLNIQFSTHVDALGLRFDWVWICRKL